MCSVCPFLPLFKGGEGFGRNGEHLTRASAIRRRAERSGRDVDVGRYALLVTRSTPILGSTTAGSLDLASPAHSCFNRHSHISLASTCPDMKVTKLTASPPRRIHRTHNLPPTLPPLLFLSYHPRHPRPLPRRTRPLRRPRHTRRRKHRHPICRRAYPWHVAGPARVCAG